jgi:hypothetical protein
MLQPVIEGLPSALVAVAGIVVAGLLLRRSWLAAFLTGLGSLLVLGAYVLSTLFLPAYGFLIGLSIAGQIKASGVPVVENAWFGIENLVAAAGSALLLAGALVAIAGSAPSGSRSPAARPSHPYQPPPGSSRG